MINFATKLQKLIPTFAHVMKIIVYILSIYILVLAIFPCQCTDGLVCILQEEKTEIGLVQNTYISSGASNVPNTPDKHNETCTPFCLDAGTHSLSLFNISNNHFVFDNRYLTISKYLTQYQTITLNNYICSVWRPPIV